MTRAYSVVVLVRTMTTMTMIMMMMRTTKRRQQRIAITQATAVMRNIYIGCRRTGNGNGLGLCLVLWIRVKTLRWFNPHINKNNINNSMHMRIDIIIRIIMAPMARISNKRIRIMYIMWNHMTTICWATSLRRPPTVITICKIMIMMLWWSRQRVMLHAVAGNVQWATSGNNISTSSTTDGPVLAVIVVKSSLWGQSKVVNCFCHARK